VRRPSGRGPRPHRAHISTRTGVPLVPAVFDAAFRPLSLFPGCFSLRATAAAAVVSAAAADATTVAATITTAIVTTTITSPPPDPLLLLCSFCSTSTSGTTGTTLRVPSTRDARTRTRSHTHTQSGTLRLACAVRRSPSCAPAHCTTLLGVTSPRREQSRVARSQAPAVQPRRSRRLVGEVQASAWERVCPFHDCRAARPSRCPLPPPQPAGRLLRAASSAPGPTTRAPDPRSLRPAEPHPRPAPQARTPRPPAIDPLAQPGPILQSRYPRHLHAEFIS
jgi:hypothetical protein